MADNRERRELFLTFPEQLIGQPILYKVSTEYDVVPNILGATINDKVGKVAIELVGEPVQLDKVVVYFKDLGVTVEGLDRADLDRRLSGD